MKSKDFIKGILKSYSQVFFSNNLVFATVLLLVSFIDMYAGLYGFISVVVANLLALVLGYRKPSIIQGFFGFNSLLVGLGLGIYYEPGFLVTLVVILASMFTFFISVSLQGVIGKYGLPYLSVPFLLAIWIISLSARYFDALEISQRGVYFYNSLYQLGGSRLIAINEHVQSIKLPFGLETYFLSLGAIFFQFNVLAGILISIGILIYSRIAFSLTILGFYTALLFYHILGANFTELSYSYIGFNYILTSIAIGGFFIVPSRQSYLWVVLLIPVTAMLTLSFSTVFSLFQLPIYSLPFNLIVLLFVYTLKFRDKPRAGLSEVKIQHFSPEKNAYNFQNETTRFGKQSAISLRLPLNGVWKVAQGHRGKHTHKGEWQHAWDLVITNMDQKEFKNKGDIPEDYYCYNKPIFSPADGIIEQVLDEVEDNKIGEINLKENWGNSIVIKHAEHLYTQVSHLKNGSILVKPGEKVIEGQLLAHCGNSGRSPVPHLHFQVQVLPEIGSPTISYPLGQYFLVDNGQKKLRAYEVPEENDLIEHPARHEGLSKAFRFLPGQKISFKAKNQPGKIAKWEVVDDIYGNTWVDCQETDARLYFRYDHHAFYALSYTGKKDNLLYHLYQACYHVEFCYIKGLKLEDDFPLNLLDNKIWMIIQDFMAPFFIFLEKKYDLFYTRDEKGLFSDKICLTSTVREKYLGKRKQIHQSRVYIENNKIERINLKNGASEWVSI